MAIDFTEQPVLAGREEATAREPTHGNCQECDERPAARGPYCQACYEDVVLQEMMTILQRHMENLEGHPSGFWVRDPDEHDYDADEPLCIDCRLREAQRERRCDPCFDNFVTTEALESVTRLRDMAQLRAAGF